VPRKKVLCGTKKYLDGRIENRILLVDRPLVRPETLERTGGVFMSDAGNELLTVRDVAERLKLSRNQIYELLTQGRLTCRRVGTHRGAIRISEKALRKYIAQS